MTTLTASWTGFGRRRSPALGDWSGTAPCQVPWLKLDASWSRRPPARCREAALRLHLRDDEPGTVRRKPGRPGERYGGLLVRRGSLARSSTLRQVAPPPRPCRARRRAARSAAACAWTGRGPPCIRRRCAARSGEPGQLPDGSVPADGSRSTTVRCWSVRPARIATGAGAEAAGGENHRPAKSCDGSRSGLNLLVRENAVSGGSWLVEPPRLIDVRTTPRSLRAEAASLICDEFLQDSHTNRAAPSDGG